MFHTNTDKLLFGSVMLSLDKRIILGDTAKTEPVILLNVLTKSLDFALAQYNKGNESYYDKVVHLKKLITELKAQCKEICQYRERYVTPNACTTETV